MTLLSPLICIASCAVTPPQLEAAAARPPLQQISPPAAPQDDEPTVLEDVVVTARWGAAAVAPETELDGARIDDLGAYDIGEALGRISETLGLDQPPILIVNGRRVVNPSDFLGFPPAALQRVELLPQSATSTYGGAPSQRVVNLVLQPRFNGGDGKLDVDGPTAGGRTSVGLDGRASFIENTNTSQAGLRLARDTALWSDERPDYVRDHPERDGATLRSAAEAAVANFSIRRDIGDWASSISGRAQTRTDRSAARVADQVVETRRRLDGVSFSAGLGGDMAGWSVRLGLDGQAMRTRQEGLRSLSSRNASAEANFGANRAILELPAGPLTANLSGRYGRFFSTTDSGIGRTSRSSDSLNVGAVLAVPLTRPDDGWPALFGETSLSLGATVRETDNNSGRSLNAGLSWTPIRWLKVNGQWSTADDSPSGPQRFEPAFFGEPRIVFDFATGQAVEILPLMGGNPDLRPETSERLSFGATAGPFTAWGILGGVGFQRSSSTNGIGALPTLTPELEAVFPERFQRDASGRLTVIDQRQINLDSTLSEVLSSNLNLTLPLARVLPDVRNAALRIGLSHTWQMTNRVSLAPGLPERDRLAGDGGGVSRHQVSLLLDGRFGDLGVNASARWRSGSRTRRDVGRDGPDDLRLAEFFTVDLSLSHVFKSDGAPSREGGRTRRDSGLRLELQIDNLFDARPRATLGDGRAAPGYGRDDIDPVGRMIQVSLSRRF